MSGVIGPEHAGHTSSVEVVIPIFNEAECIEELFLRLRGVADTLELSLRVIFVENGSTDDSRAILERLCALDARFSCLVLVRNFGMEGGIIAGLSRAEADAVITMQGDLEDPPELIPEMIEAWQAGSKLVYGEVLTRHKISIFRRLATRSYYAIAGSLTEGAIVKNASDFRLMDRSLYKIVVQLADQNLFMRELVHWPGMASTSVPFSRGERVGGASKFSTHRAFGFAVRGILTQTARPLRWLSMLGLATTVASFFGLAGLAFFALTRGVPFAGFGTLVGLQFLFAGIFMLSLGLISEYLIFIYKEVRPRPLFIVESAKRKASDD